MIIVRLAGGLGNQLFQLAAGKELSLETGEPLALFTGHLTNYTRQQDFRLQQLINEELNIQVPNFFTELVLRYRINKLFPFLFPSIINNNTLSNSIDSTKTIVLDDYFQLATLIPKGISWVANEIQRAALVNAKVQLVYRNILQESSLDQIAAVHVRRSDYLLPENRKVFYYLDNGYYLEAIRQLPEQVDTLVFFSEEDVSKMNVAKNKKLIFIKDFKMSDIEEFLLMSLFKNYIIANSTFSFWASIASVNQAFKIAPKNWTFKPIEATDWARNLAFHQFIIV